MKTALKHGMIATALLHVGTTPVLAHHSRAMFDMAKQVTYQGVVTEYRWQNPHSYIVINVASGKQEPRTISVEGSNILISARMGWNRETFKKGDAITVVAHPSRTNDREVLLLHATKIDGTKIERANHGSPLNAE